MPRSGQTAVLLPHNHSVLIAGGTDITLARAVWSAGLVLLVPERRAERAPRAKPGS